MKNIIRLLLLVVSLTAFSGAVSAQNRKQRLTREQLAEVQAKHIARKWQWTKRQASVFTRPFASFNGTFGHSVPVRSNPMTK